MTIRREVPNGERYPAWYRPAYRDFECRMIAYPIGLHLVARFFRRVWEWSYRYKPSRMNRLLDKTRKQWHRDGFDYGYSIGYRDGLEQGEEKGRELASAESAGWNAFFQNIKRG